MKRGYHNNKQQTTSPQLRKDRAHQVVFRLEKLQPAFLQGASTAAKVGA
jgi:hypothetical protein